MQSIKKKETTTTITKKKEKKTLELNVNALHVIASRGIAPNYSERKSVALEVMTMTM